MNTDFCCSMRVQIPDCCSTSNILFIKYISYYAGNIHELHWLPTRQYVKFKEACLVHQSLSRQAPLYLADNCCLMSDSTRRSLWSADFPTCVVRQTLSGYGNRTFAAAGPRLWNSLPDQLCNLDISYGLFRWQLKGHLFRKAWTRHSVTTDMLAA